MKPNTEPETQNELSEGVVYIATGTNREEAIISATSLKACMPDIHVTLFTDIRPAEGLFDQCVIIDEPKFSSLDKVQNLKHTPYDKTIYLDSDTVVAEPLHDIFTIIEDIDLVATIEVGRGHWYEGEMAVPKTFPEVNSGVMAFRKTPQVMGNS
jgi:hypothetical protein